MRRAKSYDPPPPQGPSARHADAQYKPPCANERLSDLSDSGAGAHDPETKIVLQNTAKIAA